MLHYLNPYYWFNKFWDRIKEKIPEEYQKITYELLETGYTIILFIIIYKFLEFIGIFIHVVPTPSMEPTINVGDIVIGIRSDINTITINYCPKGEKIGEYILINPDDYFKDGYLILGNKKIKYEKTGDIAFYQSPNVLIVHRAIAKIICNGKEYYIFKGDNDKTNPTVDPYLVPKDKIIAKYLFRIPLLGYPRVLIYYIFGV
jgi:signal peptidase I